MAKFDTIAEQILRTIRDDGRISNLDLAEKVGLSPSACLRRVQELERTGIIKGYRAVLDWTKLGMGFVAYIGVGLRDHSKTAQQEFEAAMMDVPEVRECHNVTGAMEYFLRVECPDLDSYKAFHTDVLGAQPQVDRITTYVVIDTPKDERA
jgi:DNA-binding Lrp family transcriptional regulator